MSILEEAGRLRDEAEELRRITAALRAEQAAAVELIESTRRELEDLAARRDAAGRELARLDAALAELSERRLAAAASSASRLIAAARAEAEEIRVAADLDFRRRIDEAEATAAAIRRAAEREAREVRAEAEAVVAERDRILRDADEEAARRLALADITAVQQFECRQEPPTAEPSGRRRRFLG